MAQRHYISLFFYILVLLSALMFVFPAQAKDSPYLTFLLESARQKELYKDRYWHTLLHYKKGPFGLRSLIDDPKFFLSEEGKHNPEAELEAMIRSFFQEVDDESKHPVCKFIARTTWLKEKLNLNGGTFQIVACPPLMVS